MGERRLGAASMQARVALLRRPAVVAQHLHHMIALLDLQIGRPVGLSPRRLGAASTRAKAAQQRHALQAAKAEGFCIQRGALSTCACAIFGCLQARRSIAPYLSASLKGKCFGGSAKCCPLFLALTICT